MTTYTVTVTPVEANGPGALDGFEVRCTCTNVNRWSLENMAHQDADAHLRWHAKQRNPQAKDAPTVTAKQVAKAAGIGTRTRKFVLRDEYGLAYDGFRCEHILAALQRSDKTPDLDRAARIAAMGLYKSFTTGRMNVHLARRVREQYTPYQLCALVAKVANGAGENATIGYLADDWINEHHAEL